MGQAKPFTKVQLFAGLIFQNTVDVNSIFSELESQFNSNIDTVSDIFNFDHSTYYQAEMGHDLKRIFISFKSLIEPDLAYRYKGISNKIEMDYTNDNCRYINIDPGILSLHNILLFSTKNFSHRIACGQGIYTELTLLFSKEGYTSLAWTYPDYKHVNIQNYFLKLRKRYHKKLADGAINYV